MNHSWHNNKLIFSINSWKISTNFTNKRCNFSLQSSSPNAHKRGCSKKLFWAELTWTFDYYVFKVDLSANIWHTWKFSTQNFSQSAELERFSSVFSSIHNFSRVFQHFPIFFRCFAVVLLRWLWNIYADFGEYVRWAVARTKLNMEKLFHFSWKMNTICVNIRMILCAKEFLWFWFHFCVGDKV